MIIPVLEMMILRFREVHRPSRFGPCEIKRLVVRKAVCLLKAKGGSKEVMVEHVCCQAVWVQSLIYQRLRPWAGDLLSAPLLSSTEHILNSSYLMEPQ